MDNFEEILEDCLEGLSSGNSTIDECLARFPEQAARLRPILHTAAVLERGGQVLPSPAFRARARTRLTAHMQAHPGPRRQPALRGWRLAASLAALTISLFSVGTGFAQAALPGSPLYGWKLSSESVWRDLSSDPLSTDLAIARRRAEEWLIVRDDPRLGERALDRYQQALDRLTGKTDPAAQARIVPALESQQEKLKAAGLSVPQLDAYLQSEHPSAPIDPNASPTKVKKPHDVATPGAPP